MVAREISLDAPIPSKIRVLITSLLGGITTTDSAETQEIVARGYRSSRKYSNPPLEFLEQELLDTTSSCAPTFRKDIYSKGLYLQTMVAFVDQHNAPVCPKLLMPDASREFVEQVMVTADEKNRQLTIPEQLRVSLGISENILTAGLVAHAGSRSIAKGNETRMGAQFKYSRVQIEKWRDTVSTFEEMTGQYGSPPADTYHFWGTFVPGLVSQAIIRPEDVVLNPIYNLIYTHVAALTEILRYKLAHHGDGTTHLEADLLGFHLGSLVGANLTFPAADHV